MNWCNLAIEKFPLKSLSKPCCCSPSAELFPWCQAGGCGVEQNFTFWPSYVPEIIWEVWKFCFVLSSVVVCNRSQSIAVTKGSCHGDNSALNASVNALRPQKARFQCRSSSECVLRFYFDSFVHACFCNLDRWNQQVCNLCKLSGLLSEKSFTVYWLQLWFPLQQLQHQDMWMSSLFWKQVP